MDWVSYLPIKHKIFVAGNHDLLMKWDLLKEDFTNKGIHYLENEELVIEELNFEVLLPLLLEGIGLLIVTKIKLKNIGVIFPMMLAY